MAWKTLAKFSLAWAYMRGYVDVRRSIEMRLLSYSTWTLQESVHEFARGEKRGEERYATVSHIGVFPTVKGKNVIKKHHDACMQ
jgi:hypothetical protein